MHFPSARGVPIDSIPAKYGAVNFRQALVEFILTVIHPKLSLHQIRTLAPCQSSSRSSFGILMPKATKTFPKLLIAYMYDQHIKIQKVVPFQSALTLSWSREQARKSLELKVLSILSMLSYTIGY